MVKSCFHVSSISSFLCCLFVSIFFLNTLVSLPFPRPDQIDILMAFKNEFPILKCNFSHWPLPKQKTSSWTSKDVKSFDGVEFDNKTGVVTGLHLRGACLSGSLRANSSLFRLHHLRYLDLSDNYFDSFSFLPELGNLTKLEVLDLSDMGIVGEIPSSVSSLNRLTVLYLSENELIGSFSPLLNLSKLFWLDLYDNHFSGNVPCSLLNLPKLYYLDLSNNHFSVNIPCSRLNLSKLSYLYLSNNHFSGNFPCSLLNLSKLSFLDLFNNHLSDSLETMNCSSSSSSKLEYLDLGNNRLSGRILEPLSKLTKLKHLDLSYQNTTDPINFVSLGFKSLEQLDLSANAISRLDTRSPNLSILYLDNCSINEFLTFIKNLLKLKELYLSNNRLKGEVPKWLWSLPSLKKLNLSYNSLHSFEGSPTMLLNSSLLVLDLSSNSFRGQIPESLGLLKSLIVLNLSNNVFTGHIPSSWANLTSLESLDLSQNQLSGNIPQELATLSSLEYINVSHNKLTGPIPQSTQIGGQPKSSFEGNLNLCGLPLEESCFGDKKVPSTPEAQEPEPSNQEQVLEWKAVAMGYGLGVLFGLAIGQVLYSYKPILFFKLFRL